MSDTTPPGWRERLTRTRLVPHFDRLGAWVRDLSIGDRIVFYVLAVLVGIASLTSLYALERSLLIEVPAYGDTLVEGALGSPRFMNPLLAISDADRDLATLTHAGLMGLSGDGSLVPVLAESYSVSPDGKSYTFTIRDNATFSDGTPVTADDVVFTVQKAQDPALKSPEYADWAGVQVTATDNKTVHFLLAKPYAPFINLTTLGILPERLWRNVSSDQFPFSTLETNPVGAGPFKVASVSRDAAGLITGVSLVANPLYALGRPYLDGIRFVFFSQANDLALAIRNGSVESAHDVVGSRELTAPYARVFGVFLNPSQNQVFARIEVRKALSIAINRSIIVQDVLGGYATPIAGPVPPGGDIKQALIPSFDDSVSAAAQVLTQNGWTYDGAARSWKNAKSKQTIDRIAIRTSNVPELKSVAGAVKADWEKLGIAVDVELYEPGDLSQNVIRPRKYDALLYGEVISRDQDLYAFWDSQERNDPGLNIALYANKDVDALLESSRGSGDAALRAKNLQKIEDIIAAEYPAAFLYSPDFIYAVPDDLKGVELPQIAIPTDRFAAVAGWYRVTDDVWPFFAHREREE